MSFLDNLKPYRDAKGFVYGPNGAGGFNICRYTSTSVVACWRKGELTDSVKMEFLATLNLLERIPGVVQRTPDNVGGHEGIDDTLTRATAYKLLDNGSYSHRFLRQGAKKALGPEDDLLDPKRSMWNKRLWKYLSWLSYMKWWNYNNIRPGEFHVSTYFGRFPFLHAHNQFALDIKPPLWKRISWLHGLLTCNTQDKWVMSWHMMLMYQLSKKRCFMCTWAVSKWKKRLKACYPHGIGEILKAYWGDHPINEALWDDFGELN